MNSDKINRDEVCIFIPTLNEAPTIGSLIRSFKELGFSHIFVMDGRSSDKTVEIAGKEGAQVEIQKGKGKRMIEENDCEGLVAECRPKQSIVG